MVGLRVPEVLRRMREEREVTHDSMAEALGVSKTSVYRREHPGANLRISSITDYLEALDATVSELCEALVDMAGETVPEPTQASGDEEVELMVHMIRAFKAARAENED